MIIMKYIVTLLMLMTFFGCAVKDYKRFDKNVEASTVDKVNSQQSKKDKLFEWKITKGDRVDIQAYNQSSSAINGQLSQLLSSGGQKIISQRYGDEGFLVGQDGTVLLPLVGAVSIIGMTEKEASQSLINTYKKYLKNPYVLVKILNQKLFVLGEVSRPGVVLVTNGTMTLFEALASTGDITDFADRTNVKIIRGSMQNPKVQEIDLTDLQSMQYASLILQPNDLVYVSPRDKRASTIGSQEDLPFWQLLSSILAPLTTTAIIYGVFK